MGETLGLSLFLSALGIYLHAISIALVIGGSTLAFLLEILSLIRRDDIYHQISYRVVKIVAIVFAFGAVSGTIVEFGLVQVWSGFLLIMGSTGLFPFYLELIAFMIEAGLLAFLVYGWNRFKSRYIIIGLIGAISFGSNLSGALIMVVNSWMNVPWGMGEYIKNIYPWAPSYGPDYVNERLLNEILNLIGNGSGSLSTHLSIEILNNLVDKYGPLITNPWAAFGGMYVWVSIAHQLLATIIVGVSWYVSILTYRYWKGEKKLLNPILDIMLILAILMILQGIVGHDMGVQVIKYQPTKFALIAGLNESGPDPVAGLTTYGDPNHIFPGFEKFIKDTINKYGDSSDLENMSILKDVLRAREYLPIIFPMYTTKIVLSIVAGVIGILFIYVWLKRYIWDLHENKLVFLIWIFSILVTIAASLGWAVRELGRKPWTIYGLFHPEDLLSMVELNIFTAGVIIGGITLSLLLMMITIYYAVWRGERWV